MCLKNIRDILRICCCLIPPERIYLGFSQAGGVQQPGLELVHFCEICSISNLFLFYDTVLSGSYLEILAVYQKVLPTPPGWTLNSPVCLSSFMIFARALLLFPDS